MPDNSTSAIFGADVGSAEIVIACADANQAVKAIANSRNITRQSGGT